MDYKELNSQVKISRYVGPLMKFEPLFSYDLKQIQALSKMQKLDKKTIEDIELAKKNRDKLYSNL